jgi:predicted AAA+ superfamily ATPase
VGVFGDLALDLEELASGDLKVDSQHNANFYKLFCITIIMLQEIQDILLLQKREIEARTKEPYIKRETALELKNDLIKVIIGPRRAGKSFFALHYLKSAGSFGYINFDDEKLTEIQNYDELLAAMNTVYNHPSYVFFDEIQNLPKWELLVNRLQRQGYNLIITGSNSHLLSKELATHLTGRHVLRTIFPFSFTEYLQLDNKEHTSQEIKAKLSEYLTCGGFPEPLVKNIDRKEYLTTLFNSIIYKDIVKRYSIRHPKEIENLAYYLISNVASEYSFHSLTNVTKIKSSHTIQKYLDYLEESYILFSLNKFSYKVKEQVSSTKKIYCIDNGFITTRAFSVTPNIGKLYENLVACALKKKENQGACAIYYWKNAQQEEVDFLIKKGLQVEQLIQVCFNLQSIETTNREVRALIKAGKELQCTNLLVITENKEAKEDTEWFGEKASIRYIPLWKWLMENP